MKKKLFSLIIVFCLALTSAFPVFADATDPVSEDPAVQAAWEAYVDVKAALQGDDLAALETAYVAMEEANGALEFEDTAVLEAQDEDYFANMATAQVILLTDDYGEAFQADKNARTAQELVEYYNLVQEEYGAEIVRFIPDVADVYAEALNYVPTENVLTVYDAYTLVETAYMLATVDEDFFAAIDAFYEVMDVLNELTEAEWEQMAALMGVEDGEAAFDQILSQWIDMNVILPVAEAKVAFEENANEETAQAFVEAYDNIYNNADYANEYFMTLVETFMSDVHDAYESAQEILAGDTDAQPASPANGTAKDEGVSEVTSENGEEAPETGDTTSMLPFAGLVAAGAALVALRRKCA